MKLPEARLAASSAPNCRFEVFYVPANTAQTLPRPSSRKNRSESARRGLDSSRRTDLLARPTGLPHAGSLTRLARGEACKSEQSRRAGRNMHARDGCVDAGPFAVAGEEKGQRVARVQCCVYAVARPLCVRDGIRGIGQVWCWGSLAGQGVETTAGK